jgi:hypothetical protein
MRHSILTAFLLLFALSSATAFIIVPAPLPRSELFHRPAQCLQKPHKLIQRSPPPSANIALPAAYTCAAMALFLKALRASAQGVDAAVLASTGALVLFNFNPSDTSSITSATLACDITPPASSGVAKSRRQAARTWRSVVRIKVVGQLLGLVWMLAARSAECGLRAAALVKAASVAHLAWGAGGARHDARGAAAPMDGSLSTAILAMDASLSVAALLGAASPAGSICRTRCSLYWSAGALGAAFAAVPAFLRAVQSLVAELFAGQEDEQVYVPPSAGGPTD